MNTLLSTNSNFDACYATGDARFDSLHTLRFMLVSFFFSFCCLFNVCMHDLINKHKFRWQVNGNLINTGRGIIFKLSGADKAGASNQGTTSPEDADLPSVLIALGPLSYRYTLSHLMLHYGREISRGSEHTINGFQFPGEIQFYAYNSQLYASWEEAANRAHGIAAISLLIQISPDPRQANSQLKRITHALKNITTKGEFCIYRQLRLVIDVSRLRMSTKHTSNRLELIFLYHVIFMCLCEDGIEQYDDYAKKRN